MSYHAFSTSLIKPVMNLKNQERSPTQEEALKHIFTHGSAVLVEGNKPLSSRPLWKDLGNVLQGLSLAGTLFIGSQLALSGLGEWLDSPPEEIKSETSLVNGHVARYFNNNLNNKLNHEISEQPIQMTAVRAGLLPPETVSPHAHLLMKQAIQHQRPDWLAQAGAALLERGTISEIKAFNDELSQQYKKHQILPATESWSPFLEGLSAEVKPRVTLGLLTSPESVSRRMMEVFEIYRGAGPIKDFKNPVEALVPLSSVALSEPWSLSLSLSSASHRKVADEALRMKGEWARGMLDEGGSLRGRLELEHLWLGAVKENTAFILMEQRSDIFAKVQAELAQLSSVANPAHVRPLTDRFMASQTNALEAANTWADEQLRAGFSPSEAWQLWQFKNFIGEPGSTYFSDHIHPDLRQGMEQSQKELAQVKTPAQLKELTERWVLQNIERRGSSWMRFALNALGEYSSTSPSNATMTEEGLKLNLSEEVMNQPLSLDDLRSAQSHHHSRRVEIQELLNQSGVLSLTVPKHSWGASISQGVAIQFLKEGNEALEKVTRWKGPVL